MMLFKKELFIGIIIGIMIGTLGSDLVNNINSNNLVHGKNTESSTTANSKNLVSNKSTKKYASSFLYRNTAPSISGEYYKETPILKAVVDDINWKISVDEYNRYFCEGVFENWTDVDINAVQLNFELYSDGVLLDKSDLTVKNIKSKEKVLVKIPLPRSYEGYLKTIHELDFKIVGKSRDFKNKPFNKEDYIRS